MSRKSGTGVPATKRPVIVLAGEDANDRRCLRILLEARCPDMRGRLVEINSPVRLRQATGGTLASRIDKLRRLVQARAARERAEIACAFIHEDLDDADGPGYLETHTRVEKELLRSFPTAHYVLAVEEIEAWLLLFPDALASLVSSWQVPTKYRGKDTGRLTDPKHILMSEVSRTGRRYKESDAPDVLEKAVALDGFPAPLGTNRSWTRLMEDAATCCSSHISKAKKK
ncbi:hypothetical protein [Actinocorallia libanotica]|uniref:DUF4276 family protein n=1 Tax=Actinocorallia libanotica TaxID=46162 RepID=A0ABP4C953_9ACTN